MRNGLVCIIIIAAIGASAHAYDWSTNPGNGTPDNPYQISEPNQLVSIGSNAGLLDKHYILTCDIVFDPINNPAHVFTGALIAPDPTSGATPFSGQLDGDGHQIVNLNIITANKERNTGLFGKFLGDQATQVIARDVTFVNPVISGYHRSGALVGIAEKCTIQNCHVIGGQVSYPGGFVMGGLMGGGHYNIIENCSSSAQVSGATYVGGLSGSNNSTAFVNCFTTGTVTGTGRHVGGLVGDFKQWTNPEFNEREEIINCFATGDVHCGTQGGGLVGYMCTGLIQNSFATGTVTGQEYLGGLVGEVKEQNTNQTPPYSGPTTLTGCYATGNVEGQANYIGGLIGKSKTVLVKDCCAHGNVSSVSGSYVGGLAGFCENQVVRCYSTGSVSGGANTGGLAGYHRDGDIFLCYWDTDRQTSGTSSSDGGIGKTTAEMQSIETYRGWGDDVWVLDDGNDYPHLAWEGTVGEYIVDQRSYVGGGTLENPYQIATVEDLLTLGTLCQDWDKQIELIDDIVLDPDHLSDPRVYYDNANYNKIGLGFLPFTGRFNGRFHTISNLRNQDTDERYNGLFGSIRGIGPDDVTVENLLIFNPAFGGSAINGGLAGLLENAKITRCRVTSFYMTAMDSDGWNIDFFGGLVGYSDNATVSMCSAEGVFNLGTRSSFGSGQGGLVGNMLDSTVENCYAIATFHSAGYQDGGFVGQAFDSVLTQNYSVPFLVDPYASIAGIAGESNWSVHDCYYRSASNTSAGHGDALSGSAIKQQASFSFWDFVGESVNGDNEIWRMCVDGVETPRLSWEFSRDGDFACGDGVDLVDLQALAECWLTAADITPTTFSTACDVNGDGVIDLADFAVLSDNWPSF